MQVLSYFGEYSLQTALTAAAGLLVFAYLVKKLTTQKYRLPQGPRPWPVVGNLLDFSGKVDAFSVFDNYRKRHGDIYTLYFGEGKLSNIHFNYYQVMISEYLEAKHSSRVTGPTPFIILNGFELIREAFITKGNDFAGRYFPLTVEIFSRGGKSILGGQFNPVWQVQRKLVHGAMRKYATGKHLEEKMQESISATSEYILQRADDGPLDPLHVMTLLVYNILTSIAFGHKYEEDDPEFKMILKEVDTINDLFGNGLLADYFPILRFFPSPAARKMKKSMKLLQQLFDQKWDEHNATFDPSCVTDLTYHIIKEREELKKSEQDHHVLSQLTEVHYQELLVGVFFAGTDTSRFTLTWAILFLAAHPECQQRMQREIDSAIGSREIKISDRPCLPYTEAVLHEVMRLRPIAPLLIPHTTTCETSVGGYTIPANTPVLANVMSLHMNPESYPQPDKFQPERFLDDSGNFQIRPGEWMPFSAGRRVCVGESVAKVELHILTAMLFQKFSFSPPEGKKINLDCQQFALALFPYDQKVTAKPRN